MAKQNKKTLVLIDSNALIHRAFHALPPLTSKEGTPTGAVYGVALTLLSVFDKFKPDYVAAAFDLKEKTFRHQKFEGYKAKRVKAPEELYQQIPLTKKMMNAFGIPVFEKKGYEADDIIGTISKDPKLAGKVETVIVTGDLDTLQLVDPNTKVFTLRKGIKDTFIYDSQQVYNRFKLQPGQIVDYKALRGDPSDNIPGIAGIGEKGATELLQKFKTLDRVYGNLDEVEAETLRKKLKKGEKAAYLSQELAQIRTDVPVDFKLSDAKITKPEGCEKLASFFRQMGFSSLIKRIDKEGELDQAKSGESAIVEIVEGTGALREIISKVERAGKCSYCFLASGKRFHKAELEGIGVHINGAKSYFVEKSQAPKILKLLGDKKIEKIGFNVKFDLQIFEKLAGRFQDVQIIAYLLGLNANDLEKLVLGEFGCEMSYANSSSGQASLLNETELASKQHCAERAFWVGKLFRSFTQRLDEGRLEQVYKRLELPLIPILAKMEIAGVKVEKEALEEVSALAKKKLAKLEQQVFAQAKEKFNINSPGQLASILYDKLKIPTAEIKRGKTGFSTDADQLRKIRDHHPIVPLIEQYREFFKIKSTYADALPNLIESDGRIHAHFNQAVTATGRLSSSDPNLQNIPKKGELADLIRSSFVAPQGKKFVSADYSQIDLRVAAHLSRDPRLIKAFEKNQDIHRTTASWVNGIDRDKVSDKQRNEAKSLNFGILYGMGTYGFMRDSGVSGARAKKFIENYKKTFSALTDFLEKTKKQASRKGYVETELGRRRYIPNINASNSMLRNAAERMAINLPIQGLAADIMKLAMIKAGKLQAKLNSKKEHVRLVLQIHDELIFEVDEKLAKEFSVKLQQAMEKVYDLRVPLKVDVSIGDNWQQL